MPNYFLGTNSGWIEELAINYENGNYVFQDLNEMNKKSLDALFNISIEKDCLKDDFFRKYFE